jgi:general secretion pathway protein A
MYLEHWHLRDKPFENAADPRFLFRSGKHEEALNRLLYSVREKKGAAMLSGIYGCGKTLIAEALKDELSNSGRYRTVHLVNPLMDNIELLREIAGQLGATVASDAGKTELMRVIKEELEINANDGKSTVVIVDEAQVLEGKDVLEELRMLLNIQRKGEFLLTLLLLGQPELKEKINQNKQFQQRIAISYSLGPLTPQETADYIQHRLRTAGRDAPVFTMDAFRAIIQFSGGIPRRINHICDLALMAGFSSNMASIDMPVIQDVARDLEL